MSSENRITRPLKGGEFLIKETKATDVFIPEEFNEEQLMIADACTELVKLEVLPHLNQIDKGTDLNLIPSVLKKAGVLGILSTGIPEEYGGIATGFNTSMLVTEKTGGGYSFSVAISAHTGIGTMPIVYYGNEEQKNKYLPKLGSGEFIAAYCLTEPDSGSDANSGKTRATLSDDGQHYILNGQKMWITNGGFADIFIVFAKIQDADGKVDKNLSAFIVEKDFGGITMNAPEVKMGIKGSDTRQIFFNDCKVPVGNLLSERGNGFKIAVNILNLGRIKLSAATLGGAKSVLAQAINYSNERKQFGKSIGQFGAIQLKLANMASAIYSAESAIYRAGQNIDDLIASLEASGLSNSDAKLKALEEYAIEAAILKVVGSEVLDFVADEGVQIYGGMGYSADAPMDRAYRDSRINRIFEGTNEINRLLTVDLLLKRAMKGQIDLMGPAMEVAKEIMAIPDFGTEDEEGILLKEKKVIANLKKALLMVAGAAVQKLMISLSDEQEILMDLADMGIQIYIAESALLRAEKIIDNKGEEAASTALSLSVLTLHEAVEKVGQCGRSAISSFADGDELRVMLMGLRRFTKIDPVNLKSIRRKLANDMLEVNGIII